MLVAKDLTPLEVSECAGDAEAVIEWRLLTCEHSRSLRTTRPQNKVTPYEEEGCHGDDLGDQTSNHYVDTQVRSPFIICGSGNTSTSTLQNQGEKITAYKDDCIHLGL
jgi:hypothetical protein